LAANLGRRGVPAKSAAVNYQSSAVGDATTGCRTVPYATHRGHISVHRAVADRQRRGDGVGNSPAMGVTAYEASGVGRIPRECAVADCQRPIVVDTTPTSGTILVINTSSIAADGACDYRCFLLRLPSAVIGLHQPGLWARPGAGSRLLRG